MNAPSLSKSTPRSENGNSLRAATSASITSAVAHDDRHAFGPAGRHIRRHHRLHEAAGGRGAGMGDEVDLDEARRRIVPVAERANRNRTPYRRAEACAPAPAAARDEPHLAQQPVHAGRADLQQQAADLGVNRQSTVPLERGKQDGHERLEAFRADPVRSLPHCDQRFADRIAVTAAGPPLRRRPLLPGPQQSDRVLAMIAAEAARWLRLERRPVFRLLKAYRTTGPAGLISKRRGRRGNRRKPEALRNAALAIIREWYWDFGPTLAAEKLREAHGITLGRETLRLWMIEAGLWLDRKQRRKRVHQPRYRRDCVGELVQVDGCGHWWFEDRGPQCTLLVFIDDATGRLMHLQFVESESTFAYFDAARAYLEAWGKPVAFYSDKHGVFRVNQRGALGGDGMTQFGRALHALNIDIICANTSQAKGRVERAHKTLQDRLVKELRADRCAHSG